MVFAHYMLANQDYGANDPTGEHDIISYEREIRQTQAVGINGFALNAGGWLKEPRYIRRASSSEAYAAALHSARKIYMAPICSSSGRQTQDDTTTTAATPA